jgi:copper chaperone
MHDTTTNYTVSGMKCPHCVATVRDTLSRIPGVTSVEVDLDGGTATVEGNADPGIVADALTAAGFPAQAVSN